MDQKLETDMETVLFIGGSSGDTLGGSKYPAIRYVHGAKKKIFRVLVSDKYRIKILGPLELPCSRINCAKTHGYGGHRGAIEARKVKVRKHTINARQV